ncbi:MAG: spore coat protein [Clostridia bacterium]|nr:spore coat protein [Clostridia bacterium]
MANQNQMLSEKELVQDILNEEKSLVKQYAGDIVETASPGLRAIMMSIMSECASDQYSIFDEMHKRNWYKTKEAQLSDIQTAKQDMQQLRTQTGI